MPKRRYDSGIRCPKCSKFTCDVTWTEPANGHILRHRKCHGAGCEGVVTTIERPVGETPESLTQSIGKALQGEFQQIADLIRKRN